MASPLQLGDLGQPTPQPPTSHAKKLPRIPIKTHPKPQDSLPSPHGSPRRDSSPRKPKRAPPLQTFDQLAPSAVLLDEILDQLEPEKKLDTKKRVAAYTNLSLIRFHQILDETKDETLKQLVYKQEAILYQEFTEAINEVSNSLDHLIPAFLKIISGSYTFPMPITDLSDFQNSDKTINAPKFIEQFVSQVNFNYDLHENLKLNELESALRRLKKTILCLNEGPFVTAFAPLKEELELLGDPLIQARDLLQDSLTALTDHLDFCYSVLENIHIDAFHSKHQLSFRIQNVHQERLALIFGGTEPQSYPIVCPSLGELNAEVSISCEDEWKMLQLNYDMMQRLMERMIRSLPVTWPSSLPNLTTHDGHPRILMANAQDFIQVQGHYSDFIGRMAALKKEWHFCLKEIFEALFTQLKKEPSLWRPEEVQAWVKGLPSYEHHASNFAHVDGESLVQMDPEALKKLGLPGPTALSLHVLIQDLVPRKCEARVDSPARKTSKARLKDPRPLDRKQKREDKRATKAFHVLLLGISGSGKTTFYNQVRKDEVPSAELKALIQLIRADARRMTEFLAENFDFTNTELLWAEDHIKQIGSSDWPKARSSISVLCKHFVSNSAFMDTIPKYDNFGYFLMHHERILHPEFQPSHSDLVNFSFSTSASTISSVEINQTVLHIQDLGGKRSERQYWIPKFVGVSGILFFVGLDAYNETLPKEEGGLGWLEETTRVFKKLTADQHFTQTPFVIVLNKATTFAQKIKKNPMNEIFSAFPDPTKGSDLDACLTFVKDQFEALFKGQDKANLIFATADTLNFDSCHQILDTISDTLLLKIPPLEFDLAKTRSVVDFKKTKSTPTPVSPKHGETHTTSTPRLPGGLGNALKEKKHIYESQSMMALLKQQEDQIRDLTQKLKDAENKTQSAEIARLEGIIHFKDEEIRRLELDLAEKCALIGGMVTDKKVMALLKDRDTKIKSVEKQLEKERRQAQEIQNKTLLWLSRAPNIS